MMKLWTKILDRFTRCCSTECRLSIISLYFAKSIASIILKFPFIILPGPCRMVIIGPWGLCILFCSSSGHRDAVVLGDYFFLEKSFIFRFNLFIQLINYVSRFIGSWHSSSRVMILGLTFLLSQYFLPYIMIQFNLKINQLLIIDRLRSAEKYVRWLFPSYGMK